MDKSVKHRDLHTVLAANLAYYMGRAGIENASQFEARVTHAVGRKAIDQNTIRNYLDYTNTRATKSPAIKADGKPGKRSSFPVVDKLMILAGVLSCEVWQLLHPNPKLGDYIASTAKSLEVDLAPKPLEIPRGKAGRKPAKPRPTTIA